MEAAEQAFRAGHAEGPLVMPKGCWSSRRAALRGPSACVFVPVFGASELAAIALE
jgi:hypothetical protein